MINTIHADNGKIDVDTNVYGDAVQMRVQDNAGGVVLLWLRPGSLKDAIAILQAALDELNGVERKEKADNGKA